jgi:LPXTG-motif cell wall-anchored protein
VLANYTTLLLSSSSATSPIGNATLIRTGVDDRVWLALVAMLLLAAGAFVVLDRRRRLNA